MASQSKSVALVTGACGEVGRALVPSLINSMGVDVIGIDIKDPEPTYKNIFKKFVKDTVVNRNTLDEIFKNEKVDIVFHLASILSTEAEKNPEKAHIVNVAGTSNLLEISNKYAYSNKKDIRFIFPSTIAVYGISDIKEKEKQAGLNEEQFNNPITIYGITKLYCENLGAYYSNNYKLLGGGKRYLDFRCVRFPGLISALTLPTGGTSDYAPEMLHTAAQGQTYESFVRADTTLPFMAMPDAVNALIQISKVDRSKMKRNIYNVTGFSASAQEIADLILSVFPNTAISYNPDENRQKIVDSWPKDINDQKARNDWQWQPQYDFKDTFEKYLIPEIKQKYSKK